jgi:hypothetical protein
MGVAPQPYNTKLQSLADLATPASISLLAMNSSGAVVDGTSVLNSAINTALDIRPVVILLHGDSNANGEPLNSLAQSWEVLSRSELQILNNVTLLFESLNIGENNSGAVGSSTGAASGKHGLELILANCLRLGDLQAPMYVVKAAMGGTRISEWSVGNVNGYWASFLERIAAVETHFGTTDIRWIVWNSSGINESLDAMDSNVYKAQLISHFAKIRARLGDDTAILHLHLPTGYVGYIADYATRINEVAAEYPNTYAIETNNIETAVDNIHWSYQGMKNLGERLVAKTRTLLGQESTHVEFQKLLSCEMDGLSIRVSDASHAGGVSVKAISNEGPWSVVANFESQSASSATLVAIDDNETAELRWNFDRFLANFFWYGTAFYGGTGLTDLSNAATGFTFPSKVKFEKSGNDITISSTTDGGSTWTVRHTLANALVGKTALWVKMVSEPSGTPVGSRIKVNAYHIGQPTVVNGVAAHNHSATEITSGVLSKARQNTQTAYLDATTQVFVDKLSVQSDSTASLALSTVYGAASTAIQFLATGSSAQNAQISSGLGSGSNIAFLTGGGSLVERVRIDDAGLNVKSGTLRIPHGSAPASPVDGDIWTTSAGLYVRINGSTIGPLS